MCPDHQRIQDDPPIERQSNLDDAKRERPICCIPVSVASAQISYDTKRDIHEPVY